MDQPKDPAYVICFVAVLLHQIWVVVRIMVPFNVHITGDIDKDKDVDIDTDSEYGWLSKLWSPFGSPKY